MTTKRVFNTIERAANDFGFEVNMQKSLDEIFGDAQEAISNGTEYDYISEADRNDRFDHISWQDGQGFELEADGEFISREEDFNTYYRWNNDKRVYEKIAWHEHTSDDYVQAYDCIDTDGMKVLLVCRCL